MRNDLGPAPRHIGAPPVVPGYSVGELIGVGSSSTVWAATAQGSAEVVALKVIGGDTGTLCAAREEADILARVGGSHVVGLRSMLSLEDGRLALVLDLMAGGSLRTVVAARGHLTPGECTTVLTPLATAVARLHDAGVIHADLSPGNVLFDEHGRPHLSDVGAARRAGSRPGEVRGTVGYIAPEVEAGQDPGPAADVYALGALGWLALTGHDPGPAILRGELTAALPVEVRTHPLTEALAGALARQPAERPSAAELAAAIFDAADPEPLALVAGREDIAVLTHRIRAASRSTGGASWRLTPHEGEAPATAEAPASRSRRARGSRTQGRCGAWLARYRVQRVSVGLGVVAVALAVVALGALGDATTSSPSSSSSPRVAAAEPTKRPPASASPSATDPSSDAESALTDRAAARERPAAVLRAVAAARAEVWGSGIAGRLSEVDAPGSPALRRDTEHLARVQQIGGRYVGLAFTPREVALVSSGPDRAELRAIVDASAYRVRARGSEVARPAAPGSPLVFDMRWTRHGWRVHDVVSAESTPQ